jgi:hypothetical protein
MPRRYWYHAANTSGGTLLSENEVKCPKCGSTQIHAEKRGWSFLTGMIGSGNIVLTCLNCNNKFKPGEGVQADLDSNNHAQPEDRHPAHRLP